MTKEMQNVTLSVPVDACRILYTILENAPAIEKALSDQKITRKFTPTQKKLLVELHDQLGFKLSMELWS